MKSKLANAIHFSGAHYLNGVSYLYWKPITNACRNPDLAPPNNWGEQKCKNCASLHHWWT